MFKLAQTNALKKLISIDFSIIYTGDYNHLWFYSNKFNGIKFLSSKVLKLAMLKTFTHADICIWGGFFASIGKSHFLDSVNVYFIISSLS